MCAKYYELRCMLFKKCTSSKLARLLDTASTFALFSVSGLKDEKLIKSFTWSLHENWHIQLYSRVFSTIRPNFIKTDPYNFELYRFKFGALLETRCEHGGRSVLYRLQVTSVVSEASQCRRRLHWSLSRSVDVECVVLAAWHAVAEHCNQPGWRHSPRILATLVRSPLPHTTRPPISGQTTFWKMYGHFPPFSVVIFSPFSLFYFSLPFFSFFLSLEPNPFSRARGLGSVVSSRYGSWSQNGSWCILSWKSASGESNFYDFLLSNLQNCIAWDMRG